LIRRPFQGGGRPGKGRTLARPGLGRTCPDGSVGPQCRLARGLSDGHPKENPTCSRNWGGNGRICSTGSRTREARMPFGLSSFGEGGSLTRARGTE
jgi:hypothetical protein